MEVGSVFIAIFALAGIGLHLRTYYTYGYKFIWSLLCFAFCAARCLAIGLRISLSHHLTNKPLACCCQILISAGVAILVCHTQPCSQINHLLCVVCCQSSTQSSLHGPTAPSILGSSQLHRNDDLPTCRSRRDNRSVYLPSFSTVHSTSSQ